MRAQACSILMSFVAIHNLSFIKTKVNMIIQLNQCLYIVMFTTNVVPRSISGLQYVSEIASFLLHSDVGAMEVTGLGVSPVTLKNEPLILLN